MQSRIPVIQAADESNRRHLTNVRPDGRGNPRAADCYNLAIIGAGTAGLICAVGAASLGARVALIERAYLGGDCLNFGCVPSKSLIRAGRVVSPLRCDPLLTPLHTEPALDFGLVMRQMRKTRA